ncbi:hypothetical protein ACWCOP_03320 [Maricaulaceae bacterium MS644]
MFGGDKAVERRREAMRLAEAAADHALDALAEGDPKRAKKELEAVPKKIQFADGGWKPALAMALVELSTNKRRAGLSRLAEVCAGLDETSLSRDEKGYLRLYALYRAIDASKDGRAPAELRAQTEDFRFDQTLVSRQLKQRFPLKKVEDVTSPPPPMSSPPQSEL